MDRRTLFIGAAGIGALLQACSSSQRSAVGATGGGGLLNENGTLKVGFIPFPPAVVRNPNTGHMEGHFVSTIQEIAKQATWELTFTETDWANFSAGLESNRFDVSIAPTFVTVPRAKAVAFTDPLFFAGNSAIIRAGERRFSDIMSFDQAGVTIAVTQGEAGQEYAKSHFKTAKLRALPGPDQSLTFQEVISGRADAAFGDAYAVSEFVTHNSGVVVDHFQSKPYNLTPVSWAVAHGNTQLLGFLNAAIEALGSQGRLDEFERAAGANWLHLVRQYSLTGS